MEQQQDTTTARVATFDELQAERSRRLVDLAAECTKFEDALGMGGKTGVDALKDRVDGIEARLAAVEAASSADRAAKTARVDAEPAAPWRSDEPFPPVRPLPDYACGAVAASALGAAHDAWPVRDGPTADADVVVCASAFGRRPISDQNGYAELAHALAKRREEVSFSAAAAERDGAPGSEVADLNRRVTALGAAEAVFRAAVESIEAGEKPADVSARARNARTMAQVDRQAAHVDALRSAAGVAKTAPAEAEEEDGVWVQHDWKTGQEPKLFSTFAEGRSALDLMSRGYVAYTRARPAVDPVSLYHDAGRLPIPLNPAPDKWVAAPAAAEPVGDHPAVTESRLARAEAERARPSAAAAPDFAVGCYVAALRHGTADDLDAAVAELVAEMKTAPLTHRQAHAALEVKLRRMLEAMAVAEDGGVGLGATSIRGKALAAAAEVARLEAQEPDGAVGPDQATTGPIASLEEAWARLDAENERRLATRVAVALAARAVKNTLAELREAETGLRDADRDLRERAARCDSLRSAAAAEFKTFAAAAEAAAVEKLRAVRDQIGEARAEKDEAESANCRARAASLGDDVEALERVESDVHDFAAAAHRCAAGPGIPDDAVRAAVDDMAAAMIRLHIGGAVAADVEPEED